MTDHESVARGQRAERELELTREAMAKLRQAALEEIVTTPPDQPAKRERLIICAQVIDAIGKALQDVVDEGQMGAARIRLAEQGLLRP